MLAAADATSTSALRGKKLAKGESISFHPFLRKTTEVILSETGEGKWRVKR